MVRKYCPQCNLNVDLRLGQDGWCCSRCGFDAMQMGDAIDEARTVTGSSVQGGEATVEVPSQDDEFFSNINDETDEQPVPDLSLIDKKKAVIYKVVTVALAVAVVAMCIYSLYIFKFSWTKYDGTVLICSVLDVYEMDDGALVVYMVTALILATAVFDPRYLALACIVAAFMAFLGAENVDLVQGLGIPAFIVSLFIGYTVRRWELCRYGIEVPSSNFAKAFWLDEYITV